MFLQFGYIFLFTYVTPYAAFFAFLCNLGIVFTGILKRREVYKRPFATRVSTIGAWQQAFEFMAVTAVVTNCALIAVNLRSNFPQFADWEWILMWFIIEHIIIGIQYVVKKVVPKIPYKVKVAMAYLEYHSREAYKREVCVHIDKITLIFIIICNLILIKINIYILNSVQKKRDGNYLKFLLRLMRNYTDGEWQRTGDAVEEARGIVIVVETVEKLLILALRPEMLRVAR